MPTLNDFRRQLIADLSARSDTARLDVDILLSHALKISEVQLITEGAGEIDEGTMRRCYALYRRRLKGEPIAYIVGCKSFMNLTFRVNSSVLIPRPDTEVLVEALLADIADRPLCGLDIGTGSGAIAVALLYYAPNLTMTACDISEGALAIAAQNAQSNGVATRLTFVQSDLLESVTGRFDFIVSNPPYIARQQIAELAVNVKDYEPTLALDGGRDGLDYYRAITAQAARHLLPAGKLYYEIGCDQREAVQNIMLSEGFKDIVSIADLAGRDRVVYGTKE